MHPDTSDSTHELARLRQIVSVLARHGLHEAADWFGWTAWLDRIGADVGAQAGKPPSKATRPERMRKALEELGPTFVKLGQVLAGRTDLIGPEWVRELALLQNHVPPAEPGAVLAQLTEDLGARPQAIFAAFDEQPIAAASIAQVHRARLPDGAEVIVKVRRPGIRAVVQADLRLVRRLAAIAERHRAEMRRLRLVEWVDEFSRSMHLELDLANECRQAERIAANFADDSSVVIPKVYWPWTSERVNVQSYVDGIPGDELQRVDAAGLDRMELARTGARAVVRMVVRDGLFHADPHPGNVFYLSGGRVAFVDFGMVGRLSSRRRDELLNLLFGLVRRDAGAVSEVLADWVDDTQTIDHARLLADVERFIDAYHGLPLEQLQLSAMLVDVMNILRQHEVVLAADLALLFKALISAEGMGRHLCPAFHLTQECLPVVEESVRNRNAPGALLRRSVRDARQMMRLLSGLPDDLAKLLRNVRHGGVQLHITVEGLERAGDQLDRAATRLTVGVIVAALIVGSSIVMTVGGGPELWGLPAFGLLGFVGACIGAAWVLRSVARRGPDDR